MDSTPSADQLFWEDAADVEGLAVCQQLFDRCVLKIVTEEQFAANEAVLRAVDRSIPQKGFAEVQWHQTRWNEQHLVEECGFQRTSEPTILAVDVGNSRYAVKYVYVPLDSESTEMRELSTYVFDDEGAVREGLNPEGGLRGQSLVVRRGSKAMNTGSTMMMYGSWDCWDWPGAIAEGVRVKGVTQPRVYNPRGQLDCTLDELVSRHTDQLNVTERRMIPQYAQLRDQVAQEVDPGSLHRISGLSSAFSASLTASYVIGPHNDSGVACETIEFCNRSGPLPEGHEWLFGIGGHVHPLPDTPGQSVLLFIKGTGVYHGTLPTSSSEDTWLHGNHGSALVTKHKMIDGLRRQTARGETTPAELTCSHPV